jgi:hypothetical protein
MQQNEFMGFNLFSDVSNAVVRAYNRFKTAQNIRNDHGDVLASRYLGVLPEAERNSVGLIAALIQNKSEQEVSLAIREYCGNEQ